MSWKTTLYDYVHFRNQMDIDYSVEPMSPFVEDASYLNAQALLLSRRAATDKERGLSPLKNETRLSISGVTEQDGRVVADIMLKRSSVGMIGGGQVEEQRVEKERITLVPSDGGYSIVRVQPWQSEPSPRAKTAAAGGMLEADDIFTGVGLMQAPSVPYLHPGVVPAGQLSAARGVYNRSRVAEYADEWWDGGTRLISPSTWIAAIMCPSASLQAVHR
ncbi:hypothetical protein LJK88_03040 [Paenibacillus sp. P26]|nr:hypothetical protein LJK88_03040 [Paenibacillus sp. P26]